MIQIELTDEQFRKFQKFLSDTKDWSLSIENSEEIWLSNTNCSDRSFYDRHEQRITKEQSLRQQQIEEIQQMFGG